MHATRSRLAPLLVCAVAATLAACSAAPAGPTSARPSLAPAPILETVPPTPPPGLGEVPADVMAAARADLASLLGDGIAGAAEVVRAEAVIWPDGSLGCPIPGRLYVQVETPGYWIVLRTEGTEYDYRATEAGFVQPCERGIRPAP